MTRLLAMTVLACSDARSMLHHHAPSGDDGFADLAGLLGAGEFVDLQRDLLADKRFQLRCLGVVVGDDLKCFRSSLEIAQPVWRRQPARLGRKLVGGDTLALLATTDAQSSELSR